MHSEHLPGRSVLVLLALLMACPAGATDVDGPGDCLRFLNDFGDAPEAIDAYPGVLGAFPTCTAVSPPGTMELDCAPVSTPPGPTGFVLHTTVEPGTGFWLGCGIDGDEGIDSEPDGKVSLGGPVSLCADIPVDCVEPTALGPYGQDECLGSTDAGLDVLPDLVACVPATVDF
ncbi:MAG TPA: hypothetical protein VKU85_06380, partial [bacterium]|nr:hypothetical protein [bacterium]